MATMPRRRASLNALRSTAAIRFTVPGEISCPPRTRVRAIASITRWTVLVRSFESRYMPKCGMRW